MQSQSVHCIYVCFCFVIDSFTVFVVTINDVTYQLSYLSIRVYYILPESRLCYYFP